MDPRELKTNEEWLDILKTVSSETGMEASLTDEKGKLLIEEGSRYPLCLKIRENSESLTFICSQSNTSMLAMVLKTLKPIVEECEAGFLRMVVPVLHEGELVGQVTACGVRGDDVDSFLIAKQVGIEESLVDEMKEKSPLGDEDQLQELAKKYFERINPA